MKEFKLYLDSLLQTLGNNFQKKEDHIFTGVFILVSGVLIYEILKWIYQYLDITKLFILLFVVFLGFVLRKHFGTNTKKSAIVERLYSNKERIMHLIFIWFFVLLVLSFVLLGEEGFHYVIYFCVGAYVVMKFLGFKIQGSIDKIPFKSENSLYFLIIGWCFLYIVTTYSLDIYDAGNLSVFIHVGVGIMYFVGYSYFFTNLFAWILGRDQVTSSTVSTATLREKVSPRIRRRTQTPGFFARNIYGILSLCTIFIVVGILFLRPEGDSVVSDDNLLTGNILENTTNNEIPLAVEEQVEPEFRVAVRRVSELYEFNNRLEVGSEGDEVQRLQGFLASKGYYTGELDGIFDEETRVGLRETLIGECGWPDSTFGVLGTQASVCINNMEVEYKVAITSDELEELVADENSSDEFNAQEDFSPDQLVIGEEGGEENIEIIEDDATVELFIGDSGSLVTNLQNTLITLGYLASEADGNFDLTTSLALKSALVAQCGFSEDIDGNYDEAAIACITTLTQ